jgi:hypothetical protein
MNTDDRIRDLERYRDRLVERANAVDKSAGSVATDIEAISKEIDGAITRGGSRDFIDARLRALDELQRRFKDLEDASANLWKRAGDLDKAIDDLQRGRQFGPQQGRGRLGWQGLGTGVGGGPGAVDWFDTSRGIGRSGGGSGGPLSSGGTSAGAGGTDALAGGTHGVSEWRDIDGAPRGNGTNPGAREDKAQGNSGQHDDPSGAREGHQATSEHEQHGSAAAARPRHPSNESKQTESSTSGHKKGASTDDPTRDPSGLTGNRFVDASIMRNARFQLGFIAAPLGPSRALRPDDDGDAGYADISDFDPNVDPNAPVINPGEDYGGPRRHPRYARQGSITNPYIEALYPDGAPDNTPAFDPTVDQPPVRPDDPAAGGGVHVAFSAGVRSPTLNLVAARAGRVSRSR